jgi:large subunit ribosomal protein L19e
MKNLNKRKILASKVLGVGKQRIIFDTARLEEIKEAITKQDIRDLYEAGAIRIREIIGMRIKEKRTTRRGPGKIKFRVHDTKREYIILTRKFRKYIVELKKQGKIDQEKYLELRKMIKARAFKDKAHLKDHIEGKL